MWRQLLRPQRRRSQLGRRSRGESVRTSSQDWEIRSCNALRSLTISLFPLNAPSHVQEFATIESINAGKPVKLTRNSDVPFSADNLRYFGAAVRRQVRGCPQLTA